MIPDFETSEHFELLSAYVDGELNPEEIALIQSLIAENQNLQQEYERLLKLKAKIKYLKTPPSPIPPEQISQRVVVTVKQQEKKRWLWGGCAIAAVCVATISGLLNTSRVSIPQFATSPPQDKALIFAVNQISRQQLNQYLDDNLMIKLNEPPVEMK